jgi:hypothetical protein
LGLASSIVPLEQAARSQQAPASNEPERAADEGRSQGLDKLRCTLLPFFMAVLTADLRAQKSISHSADVVRGRAR